jgi:ABC-type glycerol-3-phosphate transport system permease component
MAEKRAPAPAVWRQRVGRVMLQVPLLIMAVAVLFPLYFMVANSLKSDPSFARSALSIPFRPCGRSTSRR